jgi:Fe2+ transport system protein B
MDLSNYTVSQLKQIIQNYNLHYHIQGYSKLPRKRLEEIINEFMIFIDGKLMNNVNALITLPQNNSNVKNKMKKGNEKNEQVIETPIFVMEKTRKNLDKEVEEFNRLAKIYYEQKNSISKEIFNKRKQLGEKMTASKINTLKKNVVLKNPELKQMQKDLFTMSDNIGQKFKDLEQWGFNNGLSEKQVSPFVSNIKMYDVS